MKWESYSVYWLRIRVYWEYLGYNLIQGFLYQVFHSSSITLMLIVSVGNFQERDVLILFCDSLTPAFSVRPIYYIRTIKIYREWIIF